MIFISDSGRGYLTLTIVIGIFTLGIWLIPQDYLKTGLSLLFLLSGIILWSLGILWNQERLVYDDKSETYFKEKNTYRILFLPMQYWGLVFFFFGIGNIYQKNLIHALIYTIIAVLLVIASLFLLNKKTDHDYYITKKNNIKKR